MRFAISLWTSFNLGNFIMSRPAVAILSTENLLHNIKIIKERVKPAKVIAMVKANAYGHGIRSVGLRLDGYADELGVASIDEAFVLRKAGVQSPIILMQGVYEAGELLLAAKEGFEVVFNNEAQLEWLNAIHLPVPLRSWIKINTGMGRLGFSMEDARNVYQYLSGHKGVVQPVKVMSHFACSDECTHPLNQRQIALFNQFIEGVDTEYSLCNSAGILHFPDCFFNYVRPGILLYGISPVRGKTGKDFGLKPVMTLQTRLTSVHTFKKGASIGYGARYQCPEDMPVGIAAFGYGDGYPVSARDGTPILVNQVECCVIGRVSMDMLAVDLRSCPNAKVGDSVTLWGEGLPLERVVENTSNIVWDMITGVQNRVKFLWTDGLTAEQQ